MPEKEMAGHARQRVDRPEGLGTAPSLTSENSVDGRLQQHRVRAAAPDATILLPWPPSLNNLYANGAKGRYRTPRYDTWLLEAGLRLRRQRPEPLPGPFSAEMVFERPDERQRDLDGLAKAPLDLMVKAGLVVDDHLCQDLRLRWSGAPARTPGSVLIFLWNMSAVAEAVTS